MYCKRILILQQSDARFAERNKELCGMVKIVSSTQTDVTVFITNAKDTFGEWWLLLSFNGTVFSHLLQTLNNDVFTLPLQNLDNVACLLLKKEETLAEAAQAQYDGKNLCYDLRKNMFRYVTEETTPYEQFVASTKNFYEGLDVQKLCSEADSRYASVEQYSSAFERFYAAGADTDYYQTVKGEIGKVFVQFPPYYPLIRKFSQSFFVKVDFPLSEKYFVLGVLQEKGIVRYICYGLPAEKKDFQDKDFVFVENTPTNFWMLFQDAITGQITTLATNK